MGRAPRATEIFPGLLLGVEHRDCIILAAVAKGVTVSLRPPAVTLPSQGRACLRMKLTERKSKARSGANRIKAL